MPAAANVYDHAARQRAALANGDARAAAEIVDAYGDAWRDIARHLDAVTDLITEARLNGEPVSPAWLHQQRRLETLARQVEARITEFAAQAGPIIQARQADAVRAAQHDAAQLVADAAGDFATIGAGFDTVDDRVLAQLVGHLTPRSPLGRLLEQLGPDAAARLRGALINGVARGLSPREMVRDARDALGGNLARALTIARTETLRAYRESTRLAYKQNPDVVLGWRWRSARDVRTCAVCWAMDGTEHGPDERLDGHPNCRCAMIPLTPTWSDLGAEGVPGAGIVDYGDTGQQAFAKLAPQQQRAILGPAKHHAYTAGDLDLGDVVGRDHSKEWGTMRRERSLRDINAERDAGVDTTRERLGAQRLARPDVTLAALVDVDPVITRDALRAARHDLDNLRARMRTEASDTVRDIEAQFEQLEGGRLGRPNAGGEWDWYRNLSEDERKRLRRDWVGGVDESGPDVMGDRMRRLGHFDPAVDPIEQWLEMTRRRDAAAALARGKTPSPKPYGGRRPTGLTHALEDDGYDPFTLAGGDRDAIRHVAETNWRITTGAEPGLDDWVPPTLKPAKRGPSPWEMNEDDYVAEVEELRDVLRYAELDDYGYPTDPAFVADLERLDELDVAGVDPYGEDPDDPAVAYRLITELARRQGLT